MAGDACAQVLLARAHQNFRKSGFTFRLYLHHFSRQCIAHADGAGPRGGQGHIPCTHPQAYPVAFLKSADEAWPKREEHKGDIPGEKSDVHFGGYLLDKAGRPTMLYKHKHAEFEDTRTPVKSGGLAGFSRNLKITGSDKLDGLHVFLGRDRKIEDLGDGSFRIGEALTIKIAGDGCDKPIIKPNQGGFDLLVPVAAGRTTATVEGVYQW